MNFHQIEEHRPLTWSDLRAAGLLESSLSGALAGGSLNAWKRTLLLALRMDRYEPSKIGGTPGIVPGIVTGAFIATAFQLVINELEVVRVKVVSRKPTVQPIVSPKGSKPLGERILGILGLHRISDEELLQRYITSRDQVLKRIAQLEAGKNARQEPGGPSNTTNT